MSLLLLWYCFFCSDNTSLKTSFTKFFKTKVGLISVFFVVFLHIGVGLADIGTRIIVEDGNKSIDKHYLEKVLEEWKKTNINDLNRNTYNAKKLVARELEY